MPQKFWSKKKKGAEHIFTREVWEDHNQVQCLVQEVLREPVAAEGAGHSEGIRLSGLPPSPLLLGSGPARTRAHRALLCAERARHGVLRGEVVFAEALLESGPRLHSTVARHRRSDGGGGGDTSSGEQPRA